MRDAVARQRIDDLLHAFDVWRETTLRDHDQVTGSLSDRIDAASTSYRVLVESQQGFLPRQEYDARHQQLQNELDLMNEHMTRIDVALSRLEGVDVRSAQQRALTFALVTIAVAVIGLAITLIIHFSA